MTDVGVGMALYVGSSQPELAQLCGVASRLSVVLQPPSALALRWTNVQLLRSVARIAFKRYHLALAARRPSISASHDVRATPLVAPYSHRSA